MSCSFKFNNTYNTLVPCGKSNKQQKSYLYSLNIEDGSWDGSKLIFSKDNVNLIKFTDRPFRIAHESMGVSAERTIDKLFKEKSSNSFTVDPPNAVLSTSSGQAAFEIKKVNVNNGNVKMMLLPIGHKMLKNVIGRFSLFIDNSMQVLEMGNESAPAWVRATYNTGIVSSSPSYLASLEAAFSSSLDKIYGS